MKRAMLETAKVKAEKLREAAKAAGDKYMAALEAYETAKDAYKVAQKESDVAFDAADQAEMVVAVLTKAVRDE